MSLNARQQAVDAVNALWVPDSVFGMALETEDAVDAVIEACKSAISGLPMPDAGDLDTDPVVCWEMGRHDALRAISGSAANE